MVELSVACKSLERDAEFLVSEFVFLSRNER